MGLFDTLVKVAEGLSDMAASDTMQDKVMDRYISGEISDEQFQRYQNGLTAYDEYKAKKKSNGKR